MVTALFCRYIDGEEGTRCLQVPQYIKPALEAAAAAPQQGPSPSLPPSSRRNDAYSSRHKFCSVPGSTLPHRRARRVSWDPSGITWRSRRMGRDHGSRMKCPWLSPVKLEGLPEMGYNTSCLTGLKKPRRSCHALCTALNKWLLQAKSIMHQRHPGTDHSDHQERSSKAEAGLPLGLLGHPPSSTLTGLNAQIHSRALPAQTCPAATAQPGLPLQPDAARGPATSTTALPAKVAGAPRKQLTGICDGSAELGSFTELVSRPTPLSLGQEL